MQKNKEKGAIVVEATISLSIFMFAIVTILTIINICLVQTKVGVAINSIAKDISQYTYIYSLTGLNDKQAQLSESATKSRVEIDNTLDNIKDLQSGISSVGNLVKDMDGEFFQSFISLMKNQMAEETKSFVTGSIVELMMKERLRSKTMDYDQYLKWLGVEGGINFRNSVLCLNGSEEIKIIANYKVHVIRLLNKDIEFKFMQCAATKSWYASTLKAGSSEEPKKEPEKEPEKEAEKEPEKEEVKTIEQYSEAATQNGDSMKVLLGTKKEMSLEDYIIQAKNFNMTYFELEEEDLQKAKEQFGTSGEWEIRKAFLEEQLKSGKDFYVCDNPYAATGMYSNEIAWLESKGYEFNRNPGIDLWKAEKGTLGGSK